MVLEKKELSRLERKKFCCRKCLYEYMKNNAPDKKPRKIIKCKFCHKEIDVIVTKKRIYCSDDCFRKGHKGSFKLTEEHKKKISETRRRDWAEGKVYSNTPNYFCKWYEFKKSNGEIIKTQGTWEYKYAEWLDKNNINFLCHVGCLYYKDKLGKDRVYLPDFYLLDSNEYIDIKNSYIHSLYKDKFECIRDSNPDKVVKLLFKEDLLNLGIKL